MKTKQEIEEEYASEVLGHVKTDIKDAMNDGINYIYIPAYHLKSKIILDQLLENKYQIEYNKFFFEQIMIKVDENDEIDINDPKFWIKISW